MEEDCPQLTHCAIQKILDCEQTADKPVLQILGLQSVYKSADQMTIVFAEEEEDSNKTNKSLFRIEFFDGRYKCKNFFAFHKTSPQLIQRLNNKEFNKFDVIVLNEYSMANADQFIYIKDMTVLKSGIQRQLNSEPITSVSSPTTEQVINSNQISNEETINSTAIPTTAEESADICLINTLTITETNSWKIRGGVTSKTKRRRWDNANGQGSNFSFVITDRSGDIRVNGFNSVCDKYYNIIEENKIYSISKGMVKIADKQYSNLTHDFEIVLTNESVVEECPTEVSSRVQLYKSRYHFVAIKDLLDNIPINSVVDVIGAVKAVEDCQYIQSKRMLNQRLPKRDITLEDNIGNEIKVTLWKEMGQQFNYKENTIIAFKSVLLKDFNGRSLSAIPNTSFQLSPDVPEANAIREWLSSANRQNKSLVINTINKRGTGRLTFLCQINRSSFGARKRNIYYVRARVSFPSNRSPIYKSCHNSRCFKKIMELPDGLYRCTKCIEESPLFQWRLLLSAVLIDCTAEHWIQIFDGEASRLLGCNGEDMSQFALQEQFDRVLTRVEYKTFVWKVNAKLDKYLFETRIQLNVCDFWPIDCINYSKHLIKDIKQLTNSSQNPINP